MLGDHVRVRRGGGARIKARAPVASRCRYNRSDGAYARYARFEVSEHSANRTSRSTTVRALVHWSVTFSRVECVSQSGVGPFSSGSHEECV